MNLLEKYSRHIVVMLLIMVALLVLVRPLVSIPFMIPKDYNEGYYALWALRVFSEEPLYATPTSLISNGYTPVWYYVIMGFGAILGDIIIAGRILAFLSFIGVAIAISFVVHSISKSAYAALFSGILFVGYMAAHHPNYIGMNDPQWLGNAIMMLGFSLFLVRHETYRHLLAVVVIMAAAGMTKHILIPLPLAITIWLFLENRRHFYMWLLSGMAVIFGCLGVLYVAYGSNFFDNILTHNQVNYSYVTVLYHIRTWLLPLVPLLGALIIYVLIEPASRYKRLLLIYTSVACAWGFLLSGGSGMDMNHIYDFIIALVIIAGLTLHRLGARLQEIWPRIGVESTSAIILSLGLLIALPSKAVEARRAYSDLERRASRVAEDIRHLAAQEGPVLCETMALCYWAGKSFDADILVLSRKLKSSALSESEFKQLIDDHHFKVIQLHEGGPGGTTSRLPMTANAYILEKYEVHPNKMGGAFLVPMTPK